MLRYGTRRRADVGENVDLVPSCSEPVDPLPVHVPSDEGLKVGHLRRGDRAKARVGGSTREAARYTAAAALLESLQLGEVLHVFLLDPVPERLDDRHEFGELWAIESALAHLGLR